MIRREALAGDEWLLISQIDHARLAGDLAAAWGAPPFAPLVPRDELLWAIYHHDDGWHAWEQSPDVDPKTGRPRSFTEMEIDDSLAIWGASIDPAFEVGPLEGYAVAGHFCALARRVAAWKSSDPRWPAVNDFLAHNDRLMNQARQHFPEEVASHAVTWLQFFDALSLWLCCAPATEPDRAEPPGGPELTLSPLAAEAIRIAPWPFTVPAVNLEVPARAVPAHPYRDRAELASAAAHTVRIRWDFLPA
jgi:hypothetical protein